MVSAAAFNSPRSICLEIVVRCGVKIACVAIGQAIRRCWEDDHVVSKDVRAARIGHHADADGGWHAGSGKEISQFERRVEQHHPTHAGSATEIRSDQAVWTGAASAADGRIPEDLSGKPGRTGTGWAGAFLGTCLLPA